VYILFKTYKKFPTERLYFAERKCIQWCVVIATVLLTDQAMQIEFLDL